MPHVTFIVGKHVAAIHVLKRGHGPRQRLLDRSEPPRDSIELAQAVDRWRCTAASWLGYDAFTSRTPSRRANGSSRLTSPAAIASSTALSGVGEIGMSDGVVAVDAVHRRALARLIACSVVSVGDVLLHLSLRVGDS